MKKKKMSDIINKAVYLSLAVLLGVVFFSLAFRQIVTANTSGWQSGTISLFVVVLPVMGIIAFVVILLNTNNIKEIMDRSN